MLTRKQHELLMFIHERLKATGVSPSFEEMKDALGLHSKSGIHRLISALQERGFLRRLPHKARALEILKLPDESGMNVPQKGRVVSGASDFKAVFGKSADAELLSGPLKAANEGMTSIPMHGRIAAGLPIEALENVDEHIDLPSAMLGRGVYYALEVSGDSMIEAGIMDGDIAIIEQCTNAHNGDIVVALVDGEEATLKTLHRRGDQIALKPANSAYSTQIFPPHRVRIQGKLKSIIRHY